MELFETVFKIPVQRRLLVRVFAIAEVKNFRERESKRFGKILLFRCFTLEVLGNHRVVMRRVLERLFCEHETCFFADRPVPFTQFESESGILCGAYDNACETIIFCGRTDHCRTADVDLLDRVFGRHAILHYCLFERVQINDNKINRLDMEVVELFSVNRIVKHCE